MVRENPFQPPRKLGEVRRKAQEETSDDFDLTTPELIESAPESHTDAENEVVEHPTESAEDTSNDFTLDNDFSLDDDDVVDTNSEDTDAGEETFEEPDFSNGEDLSDYHAPEDIEWGDDFPEPKSTNRAETPATPSDNEQTQILDSLNAGDNIYAHGENEAHEPFDDSRDFATEDKNDEQAGNVSAFAPAVTNLENLDSSRAEEPDNTEDESDPQSQPPKSKMHTILWAVIGVWFALLAVFGGVLVYNNYFSGTKVVVPTAQERITFEEQDAQPCEPFGALACSVSWEFNDAPYGTLVSQSIAPNTETKEGEPIVLTYSKGAENVSVPGVVGLSEKDAKEQLYDSGLVVTSVTKVDSSGKPGTVVELVGVNKGDIVPNGAEVSMTVASGKVKIPDWTGKTQEFVEAESENMGIKVTFKEEESDAPAGTVISQSVKDADLGEGDALEVVLAKGFEVKQVEIPDVLGKKQDEAQAILAEAGFRKITTVNVKNSEVTEAQVTQVVPGKGKTVSVESDVTIVVSEPEGAPAPVPAT